MTSSVSALRRFPVKSMGGEALEVATFDRRGIEGDRWYAVEDAEGRFASGKDTRRFRRRDAVFDYRAATTADGSVLVSHGEHSWVVGDPSCDRHLSQAMGSPVRITAEAEVPHQDMGAVSIVSTASLAWCAERWGGSQEARRLRANVVVAAQEAFVEEQWLGREIALGSVRLRVVERAPRCRMIDIAQDGVVPGQPWLRALGRERGPFLAVYAEVTCPGTVAVGDQVEAS